LNSRVIPGDRILVQGHERCVRKGPAKMKYPDIGTVVEYVYCRYVIVVHDFWNKEVRRKGPLATGFSPLVEPQLEWIGGSSRIWRHGGFERMPGWSLVQ
jgi:hypothetical protein